MKIESLNIQQIASYSYPLVSPSKTDFVLSLLLLLLFFFLASNTQMYCIIYPISLSYSQKLGMCLWGYLVFVFLLGELREIGRASCRERV